MKKTFNRERFFGNIYALIKQKKKKVGDVEKLADVSAGYLARLARDKEGSVPSVEFVTNIAAALEVTVDFLLYANVGSLTPNEKYIMTVLEQLISDTQCGEIEWECEKGYVFREVSEPGRVGGFTHPLFKENDMPDNGITYLSSYMYQSGFAGEYPVDVCGDCYNTELPLADARIYIMNAKPENYSAEQRGFEIYLVSGEEVLPLACTWEVADEIRKKIETLYDTIAEAMSHVKLGDKAKGILDRYLQSGRPIRTASVNDDDFMEVPDEASGED